MIDLSVEKPIPLKGLPAFLEKLNGRRIHISGVYRLINKGVSGVVLETCYIGSTQCTTEQAVLRFCQEVTEAKRASKRLKLPPATELSATKAHERALKKLATNRPRESKSA